MVKNLDILDDFRNDKEYNYFITPISFKNVDNLTQNEILSKLIEIQDIANTLHVTEKKVLSTINKMLGKQIKIDDLVNYHELPTGSINSYGVLAAKKCAAVRKYKYGYTQTVYYDMFLIASQYRSIALNKVFRQILCQLFPNLFIKNNDNICLFKETYKYTPEEKSFLKSLHRSTPLNFHFLNINDLTINDIMLCVANKKRIDDIIWKSRMECYYDYPIIFFYLYDKVIDGKQYKQSLYVPIEALFAKDYNMIAETNVCSIPTQDKNGTIIFKSGKQKDMDYFKSNIAQKILKFILK